MRATFFNAQWAVMAKRWPWADGEKEAMQFYRERLKARALDVREHDFGEAVERLVSRQWNNRPSVEQVVAEVRRNTARPAEDPREFASAMWQHGLRNALDTGALDAGSTVAEIAAFLRCSPSEATEAWRRVVFHRQCPACGFGLALKLSDDIHLVQNDIGQTIRREWRGAYYKCLGCNPAYGLVVLKGWSPTRYDPAEPSAVARVPADPVRAVREEAARAPAPEPDPGDFPDDEEIPF